VDIVTAGSWGEPMRRGAVIVLAVQLAALVAASSASAAFHLVVRTIGEAGNTDPTPAKPKFEVVGG
jgi:hypothetical protein